MRIILITAFLFSLFQAPIIAQTTTVEYKTFDFTWYIYDMPNMKYEPINFYFDVTKDLTLNANMGGDLNLRKNGMMTKKEYKIFNKALQLLNSNTLTSYTIVSTITIKKETSIENGTPITKFYVITPDDAEMTGDNDYRYLQYTKRTVLAENEYFASSTSISPKKDTMTANNIINAMSLTYKPTGEIATASADIYFTLSYHKPNTLNKSIQMLFQFRLASPQNIIYSAGLGVGNPDHFYKGTANKKKPYRSFHVIERKASTTGKKHLRIVLSSASKTCREINKFIYPNYIIYK
jgi:hypothetical protein